MSSLDPEPGHVQRDPVNVNSGPNYTPRPSAPDVSARNGPVVNNAPPPPTPTLGANVAGRDVGFGWVPDIPDHRDYMYSVTAPDDEDIKRKPLPPMVDLRDKMQFPLYDQGQLGSCTANAIGAVITYQQSLQRPNGGTEVTNSDISNTAAIAWTKLSVTPITDQQQQQQQMFFIPSRLFIYYNERKMEGTINSDSGAMIRDGIKTVNELGACPESTWPYLIPRFTTVPPMQAYNEALQHQALLYRRIQDNKIEDMKASLAQGLPFVFGFSVYESFMSRDVARTGVVPMPKISEKLLGGHAVVGVGYDDSRQCFIVRNSWGEHWGDKGHFYMPYQYLQDNDLANDFWVISLMEESGGGFVGE